MLLSRMRKLTLICKKLNMGEICKWAVVACTRGPQEPPHSDKGPSVRKEKRRNLGKINKNRSKKARKKGEKKRKKGQIFKVSPHPSNSTAVSCKGAPLASVWRWVDGRHASDSRPIANTIYIHLWNSPHICTLCSSCAFMRSHCIYSFPIVMKNREKLISFCFRTRTSKLLLS